MRTTRLSAAAVMVAAASLVAAPAFAVDAEPSPSDVPTVVDTPTTGADQGAGSETGSEATTGGEAGESDESGSSTETDTTESGDDTSSEGDNTPVTEDTDGAAEDKSAPETPAATPKAYPLQVKIEAPANQGINKVGQSVRWELVVKNASTETLKDVKVAVAIPEDRSLKNLALTPAAKQGTYAEGIWTIAEVAPGTELRASAVAEVASVDISTGYWLTATATAEGHQRPDSVQANPSLEADTDGADALSVGLSMPYLQVDVVAGSAVVSKAGDQMSWKVNLVNKGLSTASGIKVSLSGQSGVDESTITADVSGKGSYNPTSRTWELPNLAPADGIITATVSAKIAQGADLTKTPTLSARATFAEVPAAMASCTINTSLDADVDACDYDSISVNTSKLALDLALDKGQAIYGESDVATWTVTVKNTDTRSVASNVVVSDMPGAHLAADTLAWGSATQGSTETSNWKVGDLAPGATASIKVSIEIAKGTKPGDKPMNKVVATSATEATPTQCGAQDGVEADTDRCDARAITLSTRPAPVLKVDVEPKKGSILNSRNDRITYLVKVANTGNLDAQQVVLTAQTGKQADAASLKWNHAKPMGKVDPTKPKMTLETIKAGSAATVEVSMTPSQAADLSKGLDLRVSASAIDLPQPTTCEANGATDDTDRCDVALVGTGNVVLKIDKTVVQPKAALKPGSPVSWVITVNNAGTTDAKDALVSLTPSTGLAKGSMIFVGKTAVGKVDNETGTWKIPVLPAGASLTATARGTVESKQAYATNIVAFADVTNPLAPLKNPGQCIPNRGVATDTDQCDYDALAYQVQVSSQTTPGGTSTVPGSGGASGTDIAGKGSDLPGKGQPVMVAAGTPAPILASPWAQAAGVIMTSLATAGAVFRLRRRVSA